MVADVYALLVGINDYGGRVATLSGCLNDIEGFEEVLRGRVPERRLHLKMLREAQATRQAIIDGFIDHLALAGAGDTAIFYFSGHGSVEPVEDRFWRLEPGAENQTIVCADSRRPGIPDLADKELNDLIGTVTTNHAHMLAILDCCHSGGGTRDPQAVAPDVRVRRAPPSSEPRTVAVGRRGQPHSRTVLDLAHESAGGSPHVTLSACESTQLAVELPIGGRDQGVFSAMLRHALTVLGPGTTYRALLGAASAAVRDRVLGQEPVGYAEPSEALDQPLFGGVLQPRQPGVMVEWYRDSWWLDVGAVHGIQPTHDDQTTVVAVLPSPPDGAESIDGTPPLCRARVVEVEPARCRVHLDDGCQLDPDRRYPAVLVDVPLPPARVRLRGDPASIALVRDRITGSPHIVEAEHAVDSGVNSDEFLVLAHNGGLTVTHSDGQPIAAAAPATPDGAAIVRNRLEHLSRWHLIKRLNNPVSALADGVRLHVVAAVRGELAPRFGHRPPLQPGADGIIRLTYRQSATGWQPPYIHLYIDNDTDRPLYCALLNLTDSFRIHTALFPATRIPPRTVAVASEGRSVPVTIPKDRLETGAAAAYDWMKIIAGEQRFASDAFDLPKLDRAFTERSASTRGSRNMLDRIALKATTRHPTQDASGAPEWTTTLTMLHTRMPKA